MRRTFLLAASLVLPLVATAQPAPISPMEAHFARDPAQPVDAWYGAQIAKYTTEPAFNTILTDDLPASETVPTPAKVLGDVSGAPNHLPRLADVHG
ncbi:MAG TPA: hypothetical protein PKO41_06010, partial [Dokdonella sp.]|nr:hypothetical protein [Dokdonella sp.]